MKKYHVKKKSIMYMKKLAAYLLQNVNGGHLDYEQL